MIISRLGLVLLLVGGVVSGLSAAPAGGVASRPAVGWHEVGLSGSGWMCKPAISPADAKVMMVQCDMSAAYLSADGGLTWTMIPCDQLQSSTQCRPGFHPTDARKIYAADGWNGMKVTRDGGKTWQAVGDFKEALVGQISLDATEPADMLVGVGKSVMRSSDGGKSWTKCDGPTGAASSFCFAGVGKVRHAFAATAEGIWRTDDGGKTWVDASSGLPNKAVRSLTCGTKGGAAILYCTVPSELKDGKLVGGVYRSGDLGESWTSAMGEGINVETKAFDQWAMGPIAQYHDIVTTDAQPETVYVANSGTGVPPPHHATVYRSDDAGKTWRATFYPDRRYKGFNAQEDYMATYTKQYYQNIVQLAVSQSDPQRVVALDDRCFVTVDGGKTWQCGNARLAPGQDADAKEPAWLSTGLVVTTTWNYYIDPFEPERHYIAYTDIGLARSLDAGKSWIWWGAKPRSPWINTCYELAFDPQTPGKIWGAFSNVHDIPNANIIMNHHRGTGPGGVCVSDDFGAGWTALKGGLPVAPATTVVVDPRSPKGNRTLYAGFFGQGVYKSVDDGKTWTAKNSGLGAAENLRVCRVVLHNDGTLFALVTATVKDRNFQPAGAGLYRSADGGEKWECINASQPLLWPKDFTVDPDDSKTIYLSAADAREKKEAGVYRTTDGGTKWARLARLGPEHFGAFPDPAHKGWIYATLTEGSPQYGLWLSKDDGKTFKPVKAMPFRNCQRVVFNPKEPGIIYVTTFGGSIWKGPQD